MNIISLRVKELFVECGRCLAMNVGTMTHCGACGEVRNLKAVKTDVPVLSPVKPLVVCGPGFSLRRERELFE